VDANKFPSAEIKQVHIGTQRKQVDGIVHHEANGLLETIKNQATPLLMQDCFYDLRCLLAGT